MKQYERPCLSMRVWALSDLHLSFGIPNKTMDPFGPEWKDHAAKIKASWDELVGPEDIVLIPGDISWAMRLADAMPDLQWIHERPGTKVIIKGNHDYWWGSLKKVREALPPSIHAIQNDAFCFGDIAIGGAKLADSPEYTFDQIIEFKPNAKAREELEPKSEADLLARQLQRLELSLSAMPDRPCKIAMTHYPPIGLDLAPSKATQLFEKYGINIVVFGHLHSLKKGLPVLFGTARGVRYVLTSCDAVDFSPVQVLS